MGKPLETVERLETERSLSNLDDQVEIQWVALTDLRKSRLPVLGWRRGAVDKTRPEASLGRRKRRQF